MTVFSQQNHLKKIKINHPLIHKNQEYNDYEHYKLYINNIIITVIQLYLKGILMNFIILFLFYKKIIVIRLFCNNSIINKNKYISDKYI